MIALARWAIGVLIGSKDALSLGFHNLPASGRPIPNINLGKEHQRWS